MELLLQLVRIVLRVRVRAVGDIVIAAWCGSRGANNDHVGRVWLHRAGRLDDERLHLQLPVHKQRGAGVARYATVVGGREDGDQAAACKALDAVHHALVRAHDHLNAVARAELLNHVRTKGHHVGTAPRIGNDALNGVVVCRVRPEQVSQQLTAGVHRDGPLDGVDVLHRLDGASQPAVHAKDLALDERRERQVVEHVVDALPRLGGRCLARGQAAEPGPLRRADALAAGGAPAVVGALVGARGAARQALLALVQ
mmetsp:Transcript_3821/g.11915  ORF Transcript_3821/g.11915 Transcript_3821/m.11915 type:complete len:255 (+) Transcript_3821:588-1352(+)